MKQRAPEAEDGGDPPHVEMRVEPHIEPLRMPVGPDATVSALLTTPREAVRAMFVFAHGAGAGMTHAFMTDLAMALAMHDVATLRFQFPFMEQVVRRPDSPRVAQAAIRTAVAEAVRLLPDVPLFAGGKSFGGRMTSQAQALEPLPRVRGLLFVGFPLHPAGKPAIDRAGHLAGIDVPMLFLQGTRDALATLDLIEGVTRTLARASLVVFEDADHAFHVRQRSGHGDRSTLERIARSMAHWMAEIAQDPKPTRALQS